jgi:hypothetical protein
MIIRKQVEIGKEFYAPKNYVTFGYQERREAFSVWYKQGDPELQKYVVVGTGSSVYAIERLIATIVLPDGFHTFHLCKVR